MGNRFVWGQAERTLVVRPILVSLHDLANRAKSHQMFDEPSTFAKGDCLHGFAACVPIDPSKEMWGKSVLW